MSTARPRSFAPAPAGPRGGLLRHAALFFLLCLLGACTADRALSPTAPYMTNGTVVPNPGSATGQVVERTNVVTATNYRYVYVASYATVSGPLPKFSGPVGILVAGASPNKRIYVSDANNQVIFHFLYDGAFTIGAPTWTAVASAVQLMTLDAAGNLWVPDSTLNRIVVYGNIGLGLPTPLYTNLLTSGSAPGYLGATPGTALSLPSGMILVCDRGNNRLMSFTNVSSPPNKSTNISTNFFFNMALNFGLLNLNAPTTLRPNFINNGAQNYLAVDQGNNRLLEIDSNFNLVRIMGNPTTTAAASGGANTFNAMIDVATNTLRHYLVVDRNNHRVIRLNSDGYVMEIIGGYNSSPANGMFFNPYGIWVDGDDLMYVVDQGNNRFQVFTNTVTNQIVTNIIRTWSNY